MTSLVFISETATESAGADNPVYVSLLLVVFSLALFVYGIVLILKTRRLRRKIEPKFNENAGILEQWERALTLVQSFDEEEVLNGMNILYAVNQAAGKLFDRRTFKRLMANPNPRIAKQAKFTFEKLLSEFHQSE